MIWMLFPPIPEAVSYGCSLCGLECRSNGGLTQHQKLKHPKFTAPKEVTQHKRIRHPYLTAQPCTADGTYFEGPVVPNPEPVRPLDATPSNDWAPFPDRLAFDWAHYHFVHLQSSESDIAVGLDLWDVQDLYQMLDSIQAGGVAWKMYKFRYTGPKPSTPPQWMNTTYELNT